MRRAAVSPLQVETLPYDETELLAWSRGNYDLLLKSNASPFLKQILVEKADARHQGRPSMRFFGEALVAARVAPAHGYYGSFKWLTSWPRGGAESAYGNRYRSALRKTFPSVAELQTRVAAVSPKLNVGRPVPPDLWLTVNGQHRFVEVKLPGDSIRSTQIAGLAIIATYLSRDADVSVGIYNLHPAGRQPRPISPDVFAEYRRYCWICAGRQTS